MQKLIIGCGYLGRRVATQWLQAGHVVHALTRSPQRGDEFAAEGISPVIGDVTAPETLAALPDCETVLYAVGRDRSAGKSMRDVSVDGLANVLARIGPAVKRFLYTSSTSVYGQSHGEWVDEESPCEPGGENGVVCLAAERLVQREFAGANILRLAGIYGPGRLLRRVESVRAGEPVAGNPEAYLNLIHVDDAVRAILACEERGRPGRTYLVSDDGPLTRRAYYTELSRRLNAPAPNFPEESNRPVMAVLNKRCRNARLHDELQVALQYPTVAAGLSDALKEPL